VLVSSELASSRGWRVGSLAPVRFDQTGATLQLPVAGVLQGQRLLGSDLIVSLERMREGFPSGGDQVGQVLVAAAGATSSTELRAAVERVLAPYPNVEVEDAAAYERARGADLGDLGGVLGLLTGLVVLAVAIGMLGIANTLALSVFERTRELGLLRAVGMTARQLAAMIRWESLIVALSGAAAGTILGSALGAAIAAAVTSQQTGAATVDVPAGRLAAYLLLGGLVGLLAAAAPARRASRMRVLDAIGME
jgi:putative ABC transport system permease protein